MSAAVRDWGLFRLHLGDCLTVMRGMPDACIDSVVCDPPYGIRFMGKAWDGADIEKTFRETNLDADRRARGGRAAAAGKYELTPTAMLAFQQFSKNWAREAFRVLKPGGHLLSFASTRTYHRMVCGIEDAGFEIRDQIGWVFGSGFAKAQLWTQGKADDGDAESAQMTAAGFEGWARGGLKPAWEPICVARKPVIGNVAENVLAHGTGGLNIDACRVPTDDNLNGGAYAASASPWAASGSLHETTGREFVQPLGRFPANLIHDGSDEVLAAFPQAVGQIADASSSSSRKTQNVYGAMTRGNGRDGESGARRGDTGSAARFFYCAKTSRADRNEGCGGLVARAVGDDRAVAADNAFQRGATLRLNTHPTVKPTDLMRYLCRLVTPPMGTVLDPFMGSGSTGKAAVKEGFRFVGVDLSAEYLAIAERRIAHAVFGDLAFGAAA